MTERPTKGANQTGGPEKRPLPLSSRNGMRSDIVAGLGGPLGATNRGGDRLPSAHRFSGPRAAAFIQMQGADPRVHPGAGLQSVRRRGRDAVRMYLVEVPGRRVGA